MKKIMNNKYRTIFPLCMLFLGFIINSCKKLVETAPPTDYVSGTSAFASDGTAIAVINNIYYFMSHNNGYFQGASGMSFLGGLLSDELSVGPNFANADPFPNYYQNQLAGTATTGEGSESWAPIYNLIYDCNYAVEGLNKSTKLSPFAKNQLLGEVMFLRAFFYFDLVNKFGPVPLCVTSDYEVNSKLARASVGNVFSQIINDLKAAQDLLSDQYLNGVLAPFGSDRVRPTKWAATALLARAYLYGANNAKAEEAATVLINNVSLFGPLPALNSAFLKNSKEAIWQIQPTELDFNTGEGYYFIIPPGGPVNAFLSNYLLNSFEANDQRAIDGNWINSETIGTTTYRYPYKYKVYYSPGVSSASGMSEYLMVLRMGEQYLIRAEARAKLNNLAGAIADLDVIRQRAGLPLIANTNPGISQSALLDKILHERQVELFCEWGHRWFDLRRTGNIDAVMSVVTPQKAAGALWQPTQALFPLPYRELQYNPNLMQNPGY